MSNTLAFHSSLYVQYISHSGTCIREVNAALTVLEIKVNGTTHTKLNQTAWESVLNAWKHSWCQFHWKDKEA